MLTNQPNPQINLLQQTAFYFLALLFLVAGLDLFKLNTFNSIIIGPGQWVSWLFFAIIIAIGLLLACYRAALRWSPLLLAVAGYLLLATLACWASGYYQPAGRWEWYGFLAGAGLLLALYQLDIDDAGENRLYWLLFTAGCLQALVAFAQYHAVSLPGYIFGPTRTPVGGLHQVNVMGSFLATTALMALVLKSPVTKAGQDNRSGAAPALAMGMLLVMGYVLYLTSSRVGLLGLILGASLVLAGRFCRARSISGMPTEPTDLLLPWWKWLFAIVLGYLLAYGLTTIDGSSRIADKLVQLTDTSGMQRSYFYQTCWNLWLQKPWFGHGIGSFATVFQPEYIAVVTAANGSIIGSITTHPHNELLYRMVESGLLGAMGLLLIAAVVWWRLWQLGGYRGWFYTGLLVPLALHTETELPFYQSGLSWALFMLMLYLPTRHANWQLKLPGLHLPHWRTTVLVLVMTAMLSSLIWLMGNLATSMRIMPAFLISRDDQLQKQFSMDFINGMLTLPATQAGDYHADFIENLKLGYRRAAWIDNTDDPQRLQQFINRLDAIPHGHFYLRNTQLKAFALIRLKRFDEAYSLWQAIERWAPEHKGNAYIIRKLVLDGFDYAMNYADQAQAQVLFKRFSDWVAAQRQGDTELDAEIYHYLIGLHQQRQQSDQADALLEQALQLYPQDPLLQQWLE